MLRGMNKKGQVTIFIIISLIVIILGVGIYFLFPGVKTTTSPLEENPRDYIQTCIEEQLEENVILLGLQGGSFETELKTHIYRGDEDMPHEVEYLCYTDEPEQLCIVQRAFLAEHARKQLEDSIVSKMMDCFSSMKRDYQDKGYEPSLKEGDFKIRLREKDITLMIDNVLILQKESTQVYDSFEVVLNNNLLELINIAEDILEEEKNEGDSNYESYMNSFHNIEVQKKRQGGGVKIYIISDRENEMKFQFASKSMVPWPL